MVCDALFLSLESNQGGKIHGHLFYVSTYYTSVYFFICIVMLFHLFELIIVLNQNLDFFFIFGSFRNLSWIQIALNYDFVNPS